MKHLTLLLALAAGPVCVWASDQVVTDLGDTGLTPGQLRYAVKQCQDTNGGTITFNVSGAITLSQGGFTINKTVVIDGGASAITIDGAGKTGPAFFLQSGANLTLKNLAVTNFHGIADGGAISVNSNTAALTVNHCRFLNNVTAASYSGGAIYSLGPVTLTDSEFAGNKGGGGGAIYPRFGSAIVTITGCNFHDNQAIDTSGGGLGGAILAWDGPNVTVSRTTFTNNTAVKSGGAIHVLVHSTLKADTSAFLNNSLTGDESQGGAIANAGTLTVSDTTVSGNSARGASGNLGKGGAIFNSGAATFTAVTLNGNHVDFGGSGGGIYNAGSCSLTNVTLSGNTAHTYFPFNDLGGGGIYSEGGSLTLTNVTLSENVADGPMPIGSAIFIYDGTATLTNVVIAKGGSTASCAGISGGNGNLSDDGSCHFGSGRDNVTNLLLGPLANNGGPTATHLPQPGSAAVDNGSAGAPSEDQRGFPRPRGATYDVGAVEVQSSDYAALGNISTRLPVLAGDNALFAGFIVTGTQPKKVIIRAIGPSLPFSGVLANPTLELYSGSTLIGSNDDWQNQPDADRQAVIDSTIPPASQLESALVRTLPANNTAYTAIVRGASGGTGIGVVEAYDLDRAVDSKLANVSARGFVQAGDNVLIAGTIILGETIQKVIARALGPSLQVPGKLENPTLELRDSNGGLLDANDDWVNSPNKQAIIDSTIPPSNDLESAIVATLPSNGASYTAIVRGVGNTSGIGIIEVYALQ